MLRCLLWAFAAAMRPRLLLIADNVCLRQQLLVLQRRKPRPRLEEADRRFWILACRWFSGRRTSLLIVKPETVLRWHRQGWHVLAPAFTPHRAARPPPNCGGTSDPHPPNDHGEPTLWSAEDPGGAGEAWLQGFSQNSRQVYATNPSSRAIVPLAVIPEAARLGDLGVRLLLHPNDHVQNAVHVLRDRSRQAASSPRARDAKSHRLVGGSANSRMLRLGSQAATISRSRPRQLLWHHIRSSGAHYWYCPGSHAIQIAASQRHSGALGEICQNRVPGQRVHLQ